MKNAIYSTRMASKDFFDLTNDLLINYELAHEALGVLGEAKLSGDVSESHLRHVTDPVNGDRVEALTELGIWALTLKQIELQVHAMAPSI